MRHGIYVEHVSCLVPGLHDFHGVWCLFQGWDVGTLGNTLSGCITQYPSLVPRLLLGFTKFTKLHVVTSQFVMVITCALCARIEDPCRHDLVEVNSLL